MPMPGMTILVVSDDGDRFHAALTFAAAAAAGGTTVRVHLHEGAVMLVRRPISAPADAGRLGAGIPGLDELLAECLGLGVIITLCQSGLAMEGMALADLDDRLDVSGPVAVLAGSVEDRVLVF